MELKIHHYTIFTGSGPCDYALTTVIAENCDDAEHLLEASYNAKKLIGRATEEEKDKAVHKYRIGVEISPSNFVETTITARDKSEASKLLKILSEERQTQIRLTTAVKPFLRSIKAKIRFTDGREVWTEIESSSSSNAQKLLETLYHADVVCI